VTTDDQELLPQESLGYLINLVARQMAQALHREISPYGVVPGQFAQLLSLYAEEGLTQSEMCDRVQIEQPTMANTLKRMERDGLIRRAPDPSDSRRVRIFLTEHAQSLKPAMLAGARRVNAQALGGLSPEETDGFLRTLVRLSNNLRQATT
jgi:DNA-binding MarR family transcriptional regulator